MQLDELLNQTDRLINLWTSTVYQNAKRFYENTSQFASAVQDHNLELVGAVAFIIYYVYRQHDRIERANEELMREEQERKVIPFPNRNLIDKIAGFLI